MAIVTFGTRADAAAVGAPGGWLAGFAAGVEPADWADARVAGAAGGVGAQAARIVDPSTSRLSRSEGLRLDITALHGAQQ
jgi:hypothetical protein